MLEKILKKHGIELFNEDGTLRNVVDVLEDLYLKTNSTEIRYMFFEMSEDEKYVNIFDQARGRGYKAAAEKGVK